MERRCENRCAAARAGAVFYSTQSAWTLLGLKYGANKLAFRNFTLPSFVEIECVAVSYFLAAPARSPVQEFAHAPNTDRLHRVLFSFVRGASGVLPGDSVLAALLWRSIAWPTIRRPNWLRMARLQV